MFFSKLMWINPLPPNFDALRQTATFHRTNIGSDSAAIATGTPGGKALAMASRERWNGGRHSHGERPMTEHFATDPALQPVLDELRTLEPLIYAANDGAPRQHFESLLNDDFWEVGASGKVYDREFVLATLAQRQEQPIDESWHCFSFHLRQIETQHFLLTYSLQQPTRLSRRATLWRRTQSGWKMIYHQGTPVL